MAEPTADLLGSVDGGRVLDVATGKGQFVHALIDELGSYSEIVGIDSSDDGADAFAQAFARHPTVRFQRADATAMPFADESFDTVAIAGALHHLSHPDRVLAEMRRVLRAGGTFIIGEQIRDRLTKSEVSHRLYHEWTEEILGIAARKTYRKLEIVAVIDSLKLEDVRMTVERDDADAKAAERILRWDAMVADFLDRALGRPDLVARGHAVRDHLHRHGIATAPALFAVGRKPHETANSRSSVPV